MIYHTTDSIRIKNPKRRYPTTGKKGLLSLVAYVRESLLSVAPYPRTMQR